MFLDFVDSSEKSLRPETFFFFLLVVFLMHEETHGRKTTELAYVGSIPTLGFFFLQSTAGAKRAD